MKIINFVLTVCVVGAAAASAYTPVVMEEFEDDNTQYLWPDAASGYVDRADMTDFSQMALHPDALSSISKNNDGYDECKEGYTIVELPLGPACVATSELGLADRCGAACDPPSICWRGVCVDAKENFCIRVDEDTDEVTFVRCK